MLTRDQIDRQRTRRALLGLLIAALFLAGHIVPVLIFGPE